jgi:hypothetical protein
MASKKTGDCGGESWGGWWDAQFETMYGLSQRDSQIGVYYSAKNGDVVWERTRDIVNTRESTGFRMVRRKNMSMRHKK